MELNRVEKYGPNLNILWWGGLVTDCCGHNYELGNSTTGETFLDQLSHNQLPMYDSDAWS
jgi:hypothetical protein